MTNIKAIIFDLGGVILNLAPDLTTQAFHKLGATKERVEQLAETFNNFEKGLMDEHAFRSAAFTLFEQQPRTDAFDAAWNAMLLDLPGERLDMIRELKKNYRVYLLSNTNIIHINSFYNYLEGSHGVEQWTTLFHKIYYSYEVNLRKPDRGIYEHVLADIGLPGEACIFIDDNAANIEGAKACGIHTILATEPLSYKTLEEIKRIEAGA